MGLLDFNLDNLNSEKGILGLLMLSHAAAKPGPRDTAGGLLQAFQGAQQWADARSRRTAEAEDRQMRRQQFEAQQQQQTLALQQLQQQIADQQKQRQFLQGMTSPQMQASQQALSSGGGIGPTVQNAAAMPKVDPMQQMMFEGVKAGAMPLQTYLAAMQKDESPITVKEGETILNRRTMTPIFTAQKTQEPDAFTKALQGAGIDPASPQGRQFALQHLTKMATHQPGTSVSVNTGQKGFDNTLKLRGDFRGEPIYKAHQEMQSAHSQIQQSLKAGSAIGDTAAATKIMKLLDPGSVVRESELGMALAATGLADRVGNFAQAILTGKTLNPQQRKDFAALADALYGESVKQYNAKRGEYQGIAERNGLNVPDVLGSESAAPAGRVVNFGDLK